MPELLPVLLAAVAAFVIGSTYYALAVSGPGGETPAWKLAVEVVRCLVLGAVVAGLAAQGEIDSPADGRLLGLALWIGFPAVLLAGAMIWENVPLRQVALHGGDWLAKLLAVAAIVSLWQ